MIELDYLLHIILIIIIEKFFVKTFAISKMSKNTLVGMFTISKEAVAKRAEKLVKIDAWLNLIKSGVLNWDPQTNCFIDERFPNRERSGITKLLGKYYKNYDAVEKKHNRRSGKETGERFHRYVFHEIVCIPLQKQEMAKAIKRQEKEFEELQKKNKKRKRMPKLQYEDPCQCQTKFHKKTVYRAEKTSAVHRWVPQALQVLKDKGIKLIGSELIASCPKISTSIDALGWWGETSQLVNISWKTGYSERTIKQPRVKETPEDNPKKTMLGKASHITNCELNQHQLQQLIENAILEKGHEIIVKRNLLIYLGANSREEPVIYDSCNSQFLSPKDKLTQRLIDDVISS